MEVPEQLYRMFRGMARANGLLKDRLVATRSLAAIFSMMESLPSLLLFSVSSLTSSSVSWLSRSQASDCCAAFSRVPQS